MLKFIFIILSLSLSCQLVGQEDKDSLVLLLENETVDTIKLKYLQELSDKYRNLDLDKYQYYCNQGLELSIKVSHKYYQGIFTQELGYYYRKKSKIDSAYLFYENAQNLFLKIKDSSSYYYVSYDLGNLYRASGKYVEAQKMFLEGISYYSKQADDLSNNRTRIGKFNLADYYRE